MVNHSAEDELAAWRGFLRAHAELTRALDAELVERHGLPLSSYEVLLFLASAPDGSVRMHELADSVVLSRSGLTRLVDRLERAGLVERIPCDTDQRGFLAMITERGRRSFEAAGRTHLRGIHERFIDRLSARERRELARTWEKLLS